MQREHRILVLGASGQLGKALRRASQGSRHRYLFASRQELDISDAKALSRLLTKERVSIVVNCAAYTQVDRAEDDAEEAYRINSEAVAILAKLVQECGALLIHISTDYVFSTSLGNPISEDMPPAPLNVYGWSKLRGEEAILASGAKHLILRTSWLYSLDSPCFLTTMLRLFRERESLSVVHDQIGTPTYAEDLARFIVYVLESGQESKQGIYHYSNEGEASWYDFAQTIADLSGLAEACTLRPCSSEEYPSRALRPTYSVLDKTLVKETFQIIIRPWQDALVDCLRAYPKQD